MFGHDIRAAGVTFRNPPSPDGPSTATSMIFVTADGQRTMNTYLGACVELGPDDVDPELVAGAAITYLEGYLWDRPEAKAACRKAAAVCHDAGKQLALTLSDGFCVDRWRDEFRELIEGQVDILFANEGEITSLYEAASFDAALQEVRRHVHFAALTRGAKGSVVLRGEEVHVIDAVPPERVLDTTGAGDLYAAGFLRGLTLGLDLADCGRLGSACAASIIAQYRRTAGAARCCRWSISCAPSDLWAESLTPQDETFLRRIRGRFRAPRRRFRRHVRLSDVKPYCSGKA